MRWEYVFSARVIVLVWSMSIVASAVGKPEPATTGDGAETRFAAGDAAGADLPSRPNFVILYLDDSGYGDTSFLKQPAQVPYLEPPPRTPNIDRLAAEGSVFSHFYTAAVVCSPSRAALLTGRYPVRTGVFPFTFEPNSVNGLPAGEVTLAEALKAANYSTHMVGKWHLGHRQEFNPLSHGFDDWVGLPYSHDMCPCPCELTKTRDCTCRDFFPGCPVFDGREIVEQPAFLPNLDDHYTGRALEVLQAHGAEAAEGGGGDDDGGGGPFLLYVAFQHSHHPQYVGRRFANASARGAYGDSMLEVDHSVGEIMAAIRRDPRLSRNTLVFLSSDNGPSLIRYRFGGSPGELRCGKGTTYEGGQRVPGIFWWPGRVPAGRRTERVASTLDVMPTMLAAAGLAPPQDRPIDGRDISSLLFGSSAAADASPQLPELQNVPFFYYGMTGTLHAVRVGRHKVHFVVTKDAWHVPALCGNTTLGPDDAPLVFDLLSDANEAHPLPQHSSEYTAILATARAAVARHNCSSIHDACYSEFGPKDMFAKDKRYEPWPPIPFHPWTPRT